MGCGVFIHRSLIFQRSDATVKPVVYLYTCKKQHWREKVQNDYNNRYGYY